MSNGYLLYIYGYFMDMSTSNGSNDI